MTDVFTRHCVQCGAELPRMTREDRLYCDRRCANAWHHGLTARARAEARAGRTCPQCGGTFDAVRSDQVFCRRSCRNGHHNRLRSPTRDVAL